MDTHHIGLYEKAPDPRSFKLDEGRPIKRAKDLRVGDKLYIWNNRKMRVVSIIRVWAHVRSVLVDYNNGTSDRFAPDTDLTRNYDIAVTLTKKPQGYE